jgi:hypothetical protein
MDDTFQVRVRAATAAAWWTCLIAGGFFLLQWMIYLGVMAAQPTWVTSFWGPGATWESIRATWLQALVIAKLTLWPLVLGAVWLTLWAKQLRKRERRA